MIRKFYPLPGGKMSALHFGPEGPAQIVFCHANGFNAQTYRAILEPLGVPVIALDLRGHGQSELALPNYKSLSGFDIFADDIAQFLQRYIKSPVVVAGHSMGAVAAMLAAQQAGDKYSGYVGFDPVTIPDAPRIMSRFAWVRAYTMRRFALARKAGSRRREFISKETIFNRYKGRGAFANFPDQSLRDYLEGGLTVLQDGRVELSCDPLWEQAIYAAQSHNIYKAAKSLPANSRLIFAEKFGPSTKGTRARMQRKLKGGTCEFYLGKGHFFPIEEPGFAIEILKDVLAKAEP